MRLLAAIVATLLISIAGPVLAQEKSTGLSKEKQMTQIAIIYYSGWGHTKKQAEAIHAGASAVIGTKPQLLAIDPEGNISELDWQQLDSSDAIIFGSPTYMGSVSWQFKKFAEQSSKSWGKQLWKNKLAAGFTNSASINGDKAMSLNYIMTLAMQHGMIWSGTGMLPANNKAAQRNDINYLGSFSGLMAQSPSDANPEEGPLPGDLETAKLFGKRIAELALYLKK